MKVEIVTKNANSTFGNKEDPLELGSWYWYLNNEEDDDEDDDGEKSLCCIVGMGSNHVKVEGLHDSGDGWTTRVHFSDFHTKLQPCEDPQKTIEEYQNKYRNKVKSLLKEVKEVTARLGVSSQMAIGKKSEDKTQSSNALVTMNNLVDPNDHVTDLELAQKVTLPNLFKEIKNNSESLTEWMKAETLPLEAQCGKLEHIIESVEDRIFNVKIYAGLAEEVIQLKEGEPADFNAVLHVFENRLYMDEECLIGYDRGGMDFSNLAGFNRWIRKPENIERFLPYDRCLVTFRVRRNRKDYWIPRHIGDLINIQNKHRDNEETFIYIRNGENLYLIRSELDLGHTIFSATSAFDPMEPLMFYKDWYKKFNFMSVNEYEVRCEENDKYKKRIKKEKYERKEYMKKAPPEPDSRKVGTDVQNKWVHDWLYTRPYGGYHHSTTPIEGECHFEHRSEYEPFNKDSVYYDDATEHLNKEAKRFNRLAMIIQGLFDRSELLHPHPPVQVWQDESFKRSVKLLYDSSANLYKGKEPDIEEYMNKNREGFSVDSIFYGQEQCWLEKEAEKENTRRDNSNRDYDRGHVDEFKPWNDPGPTNFAKPEKWQKRKRAAVFSWIRERVHYSHYGNEIRTTCTVPESYLFDLAQYKRNDYKIFLDDPRTRQKYMKWAAQLITGEMYLDGKLDVAMPERK